MGLFKSILGGILKQVAEKNQKNVDVKTANPVVFEDIDRKIDSVEKASNNSTGRSRVDVYRDYYEKVLEAQRENEASKEIETADKSVFDDILQKIEILKGEVESQNAGKAPDIDFGKPRSTSGVGGQAVTTSNGGALQLRLNADMGAPKADVFVPHGSVINIHQYSDNKIILDGKESRFVLVSYNGQKGWMLENYLR